MLTVITGFPQFFNRSALSWVSQLAPDRVCEIPSASAAWVGRTRTLPIHARHGMMRAWRGDPDPRMREAFENREGRWLPLDVPEADSRVFRPSFDAIASSLGGSRAQWRSRGLWRARAMSADAGRAARRVLLAALLALAASASLAQPACRVLDPELQGAYSGGCRDGLAEGHGLAEGSARYEGGFRAGMKHGRGVKQWPNGDRYEGEFFEDRRHGRGIYAWGRGRWAGERYEGEYRNDRRHGQGVYTWPSGDRYAGPWENDVMTGPPTPMMQLRAQALAAAREALARPGVRVCQWVAIGIGGRTRLRGEVADSSNAQIAVRILDPGSQKVTAAGVAVSAGDVVWDDLLAWEPC
ncbi:MAG: hypothetical protein Fur0039_15870 [Rhodocyclaceae bacterium]